MSKIPIIKVKNKNSKNDLILNPRWRFIRNYYQNIYHSQVPLAK